MAGGEIHSGERALTQAAEIVHSSSTGLILISFDTWDSLSAHAMT